jgi:misacylated tRNA(Ala) deacylase
MTEEFFRADAYAKSCEAAVTTITDGGIVLDRTVFYPLGGGQPGDTGVLTTANGTAIDITNTVKEMGTGIHLHVPADGAPVLQVGDRVTAEIDWERRYKHMRIHSCLHLLCTVIDGGVTGGSIGAKKGRLDFDLPDTVLDKEHITAELNRLIEENHPIGAKWISDQDLAANPDLVRTMSVRPPSGLGRVRVLEIEGVDLQPCGGTHVKATGEIGRVRVGKIENKGKHNRRVNVLIDE